MTIQRFLIVLMKWLAAFALASGIVMLIRLFCIESYRISTDSMEEALHKGDYILVNKIPGKNKPVRGKHGRIYDKRAENPPFSPLPQFLFHNTERQGDVLGDVREVGHPTEGFQAGKFWLHAQPHGFRGISIEGGIARCHKPSFYRGTNTC